ncbi:MAG: DUF4105 domain-containing protein [Bacteroides sp.]|nr:DUF4105 domain-containing protein [Roseburia sp.]MCM1346545.1 DUF4105 domain-containing protein [Bacteroides sp.]MCM1421085.1 DUF4105 domain-containing protein [Bacteroides sp.]
MKKYLIYMFLLFLVPFMKVNGQVDSLHISLLTCTPGSDAYAHFGHSAIRVRNMHTGEDVVFNYGMFNYKAENFIYRFVKGETDYELGAEYTQLFLMRYGLRGEGVTEQLLNLDADESVALYHAILVNYLPENRVYRYNFLYDNCTTRARDIIESAVSGRVVYDIKDRPLTFRQILTEFTSCSPWLEFGIDLVLGDEIDSVIDRRKQMFIPSYYMNDADSAYILRNDGGRVPLVAEKSELLKEVVETEKEVQGLFDTVLTPINVFVSLLVLALVLSVYEMKKKRVLWVFDTLLLLLQGGAGVVVAFLFFFSEHPAVGTNWLVILFNPLPLLWLPFMVAKAMHKKPDVIYIANMAVQLFFVAAMPCLPQSFNVAVIPLVCTLLLRSAVNVFVRQENKSKMKLLFARKR